jgi:hypothetical protein
MPDSESSGAAGESNGAAQEQRGAAGESGAPTAASSASTGESSGAAPETSAEPEGKALGFFERARLRAEQAAAQARRAVEEAGVMASEQAKVAQAAIDRGGQRLADPSTGERARDALRRARRGVATAVDRIDPNVLADIVIKATALQERANRSLRAKGSVYRISEVVLGASIPPTINFSIARIREQDDEPTGNEVASTELVASVPATGGVIQALDGTTIHDDDDDDELVVAPRPDGQPG